MRWLRVMRLSSGEERKLWQQVSCEDEFVIDAQEAEHARRSEGGAHTTPRGPGRLITRNGKGYTEALSANIRLTNNSFGHKHRHVI